MNKVLISTVLACGLLFLDSPEAAAHEDRGGQYRKPLYDHPGASRREFHSRDYYRRDGNRGERYNTRHKRANKMPQWLKRDRSFRRWFEHSRLRGKRHLSWGQLFDIYRWERFYFRYRSH